MTFPASKFVAALSDFRRARRRAALQTVMARLRGQAVGLLSYEEVTRQLQAAGHGVQRGLQSVPLDAIVGSVSRYADFTRGFLPRQDSDEQRWAHLRALAAQDGLGALAPIDVYQIGDAYFVSDGHRRVSIARQLGATHIAARVTEVIAKVPLTPDVQPEDLLLMSQQAAFLAATQLDQTRPSAAIKLTAPGEYARLLEHIEYHRRALAESEPRPVSPAAAAEHWFDHVYLPVVQAVREQGILRDFPGRTEADLFVWVTEHQAALREYLGWDVRPEVAAADLASERAHDQEAPASRLGQKLAHTLLSGSLADGPKTGNWRREKLAARYADRLFGDILVPISGLPGGWLALEQALAVARLESAQLHGLYVVPEPDLVETAQAQSVRDEFERRCAAAGLGGRLQVAAGEVAREITERGRLSDLVTFNLVHPPGTRPLARLGSKVRFIIQRSAPPLLAVRRLVSPLRRALVAYDDSPKAREALFAAAYLAEAWRMQLVVLAVKETAAAAEPVLDYARRYLDLHEAAADFVAAAGGVAETILAAARERECDLLIMGGYGARPIVEVVVGSTVDKVLRQAAQPVLICR